MMKQLTVHGISRLSAACVLLVVAGCAQTGGRLSSLNPWSRSPQESAIQDLMAAQQKTTPKMSAGSATSLYPPEIVEQEEVPRSEGDLKRPTQLHLSYAKLQEQLGNFSEARTSYEKVISREPKSAEAIIGLGRLDALAGRHAQAEERFRHAVEVSQSSPEALYTLGKYMSEQKRYTEAIVELQKAVQAMPKNQHYKYELGLTLARAEQYPQALRTLSEIVSEAEASYNIGYIALKELHNPGVAEQYFNRSLQLNPELKQARYWLTQLKNQPADIAMVSGTVQEDSSQVVNAAASRRAGDSEANYITHAAQTENHTVVDQTNQQPPNGLTPEQWEQWKNQVQPR